MSTASPPPGDPSAHGHLLRSRVGALKPSVREIAADYREKGVARFSLPTFDGGAVAVRVRRVRDHALGGTAVSGRVEGEPGSQVILAEIDGAQSGSIRLPTRNLVYEIRPTGEGEISFGEVDLEALGECALCAQGDALPPAKSESR